jgi:hypothetical protein
MWKRAAVVLSVGTVLPLCVAGPASADIASGTVLPAKPFCGFKILIEDVSNARQATTNVDASGSTVTHTTGPLTQRITNVQGKVSMVVDVSGAQTETISKDGTRDTFVAQGNNLLIFGPNGRRNTGEPAVALTTGPVKVTATINLATGVGTAQTFQLEGTQIDVCKALAR